MTLSEDDGDDPFALTNQSTKKLNSESDKFERPMYAKPMEAVRKPVVQQLNNDKALNSNLNKSAPITNDNKSNNYNSNIKSRTLTTSLKKNETSIENENKTNANRTDTSHLKTTNTEAAKPVLDDSSSSSSSDDEDSGSSSSSSSSSDGSSSSSDSDDSSSSSSSSSSEGECSSSSNESDANNGQSATGIKKTKLTGKKTVNSRMEKSIPVINPDLNAPNLMANSLNMHRGNQIHHHNHHNHKVDTVKHPNDSKLANFNKVMNDSTAITVIVIKIS